MELTLPWRPAPPLPPAVFSGVRQEAIFGCMKWDPQVEDVSTLAPFPVLLYAAAWRELARLAEELAAEAEAAEAEILGRPELYRELGLPWAVRRALRKAARGRPSRAGARVARFDFHWTAEGWKISEVNSDVPGGFNEASGFARLMAAHHPGSVPPGDPARELARAVTGAAAAGESRTVALVHATAFSDDRQVMVYLAREIEACGGRPVLAAPDHLAWEGGRAKLRSLDGPAGAVGTIVRFFPGEWLPNLPRAARWIRFFEGAETPVTNPASALLTQSKRFPLIWDRLVARMPTWRECLPETRDPRAVRSLPAEGWVLKPALGRVGDGIGILGVTPDKEWRQIGRASRRHPGGWAAQRRFLPAPLSLPDHGEVYPCIGVYTIDGRAAGAYGRVAAKPLIDHRAQDAAVLLAPPEESNLEGVA